nr:PAAR-like protein [uncultured Chryseobacterium sp.]
MSASIPYTVQSGETLQDIAQKLGIKDWTKLRDYHNANSTTKVGNTPYTGFSLMTPPPEDIPGMNGETPSPNPDAEQKTAEQKQEEEKRKEEERKKNEQASKSDHDGKYFVVHGAKCVCDKAENPKQTADLQVTTHAIIVLNDAQGKLAATEEDKTFIPPAATFGKCTLKPSPGGYLPCALAPAPKWNKTYDSTQVKGKNTLTEISELPCMVGGKITVFKHGQTDSVSNAHADNTNPAELAMVNPAVDQPKKKEEYPSVTSIALTTIENRTTFKEIDSKNKNSIVYLRKDEEASFKANLKSGNKQYTSWMVYSDHQGKKENRLFLKEFIGTEFSQSFEGLGKFRIEGYGKPKSQEFEKGKYDKCDPSCSIDVEVVENTLLDLECTSAEFTSRIDPSKNRKFRKGVPSVFKAKFFITDLTEEEKSRLTLSVLDGTENTITEGVQTNGDTLTFTPKNTKAKYTVVARYTNDQGEVIEKKMSGETESNAVLGISHGAEIVRPGTAMSFSVSKMKYKLGDDNSAYGLTSDESAEVKWNLNGVLQGTGKNITIPGSRLMVPGKYIVEAYSITANAATKKEDDDWHFEVKENIVTEIKTGKKARTGSEVPFEIGKTLLNGYDPAKDGPIVWKITGPASGTGSGEKFNYKFLLPGEYTVNCLMGGRSSQTPLKIKVIQPKIFVESSKWIDNDGSSGNVIKEAGYSQEVCAYVKFEGLQGEEGTLQIYDNDSNGINMVHNIPCTLPQNNSAVFWPFTLDNSIKQKIEARGVTKDGKLHFKFAPKDPTLQILNGDKSLGEYLKVSNIPKIVDGYFCDAGDTEKFYNSPIDKPLYFKVYAINMVNKKVEVHFMTQSDPYFDFAWSPKQWKDWKDVKDKFSKETFFHKAEGTINKKGELIVKVDPSKLGKPKNYFKIAAIVKITEGEGKEAKEKAAYMEKTDLAILYATAKLPDMVENKGAVKVGREQLSNSTSCGGKFCLKKGSPKSELIREINIRLAGFGGNVPTDEFTDRTEKMVKQFQKDYMKVPETGKVCGNVLKAIDEFTNNYKFSFDEIKCKCNTKGSITKDIILNKNVTNNCSGFGDNSNKGKFVKNGNTEKHHAYEYPGLHRSLLFALKTVMYYMDKVNPKYKYNSISSGFRCRFHNIFLSTQTTNHMGKALDVLFNYEKGGRAQTRTDLDTIRKDYFEKYLDAKYWTEKNKFGLETYSQGAKTWVHVDVREFDADYLKDQYFCKDEATLHGKSIVQLANDLGFKDMCSCSGKFATPNPGTTGNSTGNTERVDPKTLKASDKLVAFIKDWEKLMKDPYNDKHGYCTIGYGHLIKKKRCEEITVPAEFKNGITEEKATELFKEDLKEFEEAVQRDVTVKLYQREFDALVDLLFNCGAYFLSAGKAPNLYKNLLGEKYEDAAKEFLDIENQTRRKQNYEMFINGNYDSTH